MNLFMDLDTVTSVGFQGNGRSFSKDLVSNFFLDGFGFRRIGSSVFLGFGLGFQRTWSWFSKDLVSNFLRIGPDRYREVS